MEFLLEEISDYLYLFCIIAIVQFLLNLSSSSLHLTIENKVMKLYYIIYHFLWKLYVVLYIELLRENFEIFQFWHVRCSNEMRDCNSRWQNLTRYLFSTISEIRNVIEHLMCAEEKEKGYFLRPNSNIKIT